MRRLVNKKNSMNYGKVYRDCIKRNGDKTRMQSTRYIVTSCHGNNDVMWSTSCLIMQDKPYIVELRFSETQKSNDSINEGPSIATDGLSQTNAVHVACMMSPVDNHWTEFKSDFKPYTPYPSHLSLSLTLIHLL